MQIELWTFNTQEALEKLLRITFEADPDAGTLRYLRNEGRHRRGELAGNLAGHEYRPGAQHLQICICRRYLYVHDVLWFLVFGAWAPCDIDHIDRDGTNCRFANLRLATRSENAANRPKKGVYQTPSGRWCAYLRHHDHHFRQTFDTVEAAIAWRNHVARAIWRDHDLPVELPATGEAGPRKDFTDIFMRLSREDRKPADGDCTDSASGQIPLPGFDSHE